MQKYIIGGMLALILALGAGVASAEEAKDAIKPGPGERVKAVQNAAKGKMEELRAERAKKKDEIKATLETKRQEARAAVETKKAELAERLKTLKDEKKKEIVTRVADKFGDINTRMTAHFEKAVEKIEVLARRIENKANELEAGGADVAAVKSAIAEVFIATEATRSAIAAQAGKVYSVAEAVTNETTIGQGIAGIRETMKNDLNAVQETMRAAKEKVRGAAEALKAVNK